MKKTALLFIALMQWFCPVNAQGVKSEKASQVKNHQSALVQLKGHVTRTTARSLPGNKKEIPIPKTITWQWDTIVCYDTLGLAQRFIQTSDNIGNVLSRVYQSRSGGIWINVTMNIYTYDTVGNELTDTYREWISGNWVNSMRHTYTYNSGGKKLTEWGENWQGGAWQNSYRKIWTYNVNNLMLSQLEELWQGGAWVNSYRDTYTYDINGNMLSSLSESWQISSWENENRYTWTYDLNDNKLSELIELWLSGAWENSGRKTCTYDGNGNMLIELSEYWLAGVWENGGRTTCTYDINGNMLTYLSETWNGSTWENYEKFANTWDGNGNRLTLTYEIWDMGAWVYDWKEIYTYDLNGKMLTDLFQTWYLGWNDAWKYTYVYNTGGNLLSKLWGMWDSGIYSNYDRYTYTYDAYGNSLTGKYELWENGNWQPCDYNLDVFCEGIKTYSLYTLYRYEASFISFNSCSAYFTLFPDSITLHQYYAVNMAQGAPPLTYLWDWGDGTYDNIPYPAHTYSQAGFYTICLTINDTSGCTNTYCDTSYLSKNTNAMIQVNVIPPVTGLIENSLNNAFNVYPNPATDNITIEGRSSTVNCKQVISIYNIQGQMLLQQPFQQPKTGIDISNFDKGVYIVRVLGADINETKKIVKK